MAPEPEHHGNPRREGRSPGYPYFSVQKALERAQQLYRQEGAHWAPLSSATAAWGYSPKSSGGRQSIATMKYYALIEVKGEGDGRQIRVSDIAKRIILDEREDQSEKRALIREVALSPTAHKSLFEEYRTGLPSDGTVLHFLMFSKSYNREAARDLLEEYKQTASYIGLYEAPNEEENEEDGEAPPRVNVGDRIQATVNGQEMFPDGAKVLGVSPDRQWVFTDQSPAGLRLEEITVLEAAPVSPVVERPLMPASLLAAAKLQPQGYEGDMPANKRKAVFPISEGDVSLTFPTNLTAKGLRELGMYLEIFLKKEEAAAEKE